MGAFPVFNKRRSDAPNSSVVIPPIDKSIFSNELNSNFNSLSDNGEDDDTFKKFAVSVNNKTKNSDNSMRSLSSMSAIKSVSQMILSHKDWRIDSSNPEKSVVFMSRNAQGTQLIPVSAESSAGSALLPAFFAIAQAIEYYRSNRLIQMGKVGIITEPRSFAVIVQGVRCRAQQVQEGRYHIRISSELMPLNGLGMTQELKDILLSNELDTGGLILFCGNAGSGKTSAVNAVVKERISTRGGYALVLGHPIEYEYAGFHGSTGKPGYVEQVDLVGRDLKAEITASMRNFPAGAVSTLVYPEIISADGVGEMLRYANRGNLVFADMHALNIEASVLNLVSMAEQDGEKYARDLLGNSLKLVVHLTTTTTQNVGRSMMVSYKYVVINRNMRSAITDQSIPLSRAITNVLATSA